MSGRDAVTGRRRQISRPVRGSGLDTEKVFNALVADTDRGGNLGADATLQSRSDRWLEQAGPDLSPTTPRRYRDLLRLYILPGLGPVPIHKIRAADLHRLYVGLVTERGVSPASVHLVHAIIHIIAAAQAVQRDPRVVLRALGRRDDQLLASTRPAHALMAKLTQLAPRDLNVVVELVEGMLRQEAE